MTIEKPDNAESSAYTHRSINPFGGAGVSSGFVVLGALGTPRQKDMAPMFGVAWKKTESALTPGGPSYQRQGINQQKATDARKGRRLAHDTGRWINKAFGSLPGAFLRNQPYFGL